MCLQEREIKKIERERERERERMLEGKAVVGEVDMLDDMQRHALGIAARALDCFDVSQPTHVARFIKQEFDGAYGGGWQCIVGMDFGCFVTHQTGCFIYFGIGSLSILLFRGNPSTSSLSPHDE
ncbi:dynein light chain type 1 family protein [Wolffia australiana]